MRLEGLGAEGVRADQLKRTGVKYTGGKAIRGSVTNAGIAQHGRPMTKCNQRRLAPPVTCTGQRKSKA